MRRSRPTSARNGSRRPSNDPIARRDAVRGGHRRPHPAAQRGHARPPAAAAVRQHAGADAARDQPLRRPRAGLGVVLARDRRARGHALRRPDPLGQRQGRRGRRLRAAAAAGRAGGGRSTSRRRPPRTPTSASPSTHIRAFEAEHGPLPENGWLLLRTGWDARAHDEAAFLNANETGPHTPGFDVECARWIAEESPLVGVGVETVGTDAGARTPSTRRSRSTASCSARASTA